MWRLINSLSKGVRSVRPSQCCSQDYTDESKKHQCEPLLQNSVALRYYSSLASWQQITTFKVVNYRNSREIHSNRGHEHKSNCKICKLAKLYNGLQEKKQEWNRNDIIGKGIASYNCMPPWHWEILLDHNPGKNICNKEEENKKDGEEEKTQDQGRTYRRPQRERFLLAQSVLQAVRWGSAVALTWSLFHYWGIQQRLYHWTSKQQLKQTDFSYRYQLVSPRYNEADKKHIVWCGKNISEQYEFNKDNAFGHQHDTNYCCKVQCTDDHKSQCHIRDFQCQLYREFLPNLHYFFNPEVNKSLFSTLWNIAANQPELKRAVHSRVTENIKLKDSLSGDLQIPGIHSYIQICQGETDRQELGKCNKNKIELYEVPEAHSFINDECSTQADTVVFENSECSSECSQNLEVHDWSQTADIVQEHTKGSHDDEQEALTRESRIKTDWIADCTTVAKESVRHEGSTLFASDPHRREKVEIEDCSCDDTGQSEGTGVSLQQQDTKSGTQKFSDSLMQILNAGSEDIKSIQDQLLAVLEGDVGHSINETEPASAVIYFRAGALLGDPSSTFNLALCYHLGRGVSQDLKMARELYEAATLVGHGWATYNLAVLLSHGEGGPSDLDRAHSLLIQAGNKGVREAQEALKQLEEQKEKDNMKEDVIRSSQSEPALTSLVSRKWSSSHSTSELDFMEESDEGVSFDFSVNSVKSRSTKSSFYLD